MNVAILAPMAAGAFLETTEGSVGGAEKQLARLGKTLVERGHSVDVIVSGHSVDPETGPSGCRLWPLFPLTGPPVFKALHPKASSLFRWLRRRRIDAVVQRGAADLTGISRAVSAALGIPFVYSVASESDLEPGREIVPNPQDRILYRLGAGGADLIVAQTRDQARQARRLFGGRVTRIPSFFQGRLEGPPLEAPGDKILWGGNLRAVKRPEWLIAIADSMPERRFVVFGGPARGHENYARRIQAEFEARENIDYRGAVSPAALPSIYQECGVLINSSETEGFPNTFLEAWNHGLQVVSSVDPDGVLTRRGYGRAGCSLSSLTSALQETLDEDPSRLAGRRERAWKHLMSEHGTQQLGERWEAAIGDIRNSR